ncbi:peroxiredoxin-like family protein [Amycolatopsis sp. H20-H5]|uniref:peroxiredoxin-like family protein n=1 Tax=Amycolatopsis sp. H20-H5 TaxID=3046309 RepID=UPI002DB7CF50|nr:peroxiredoxin-like family protein [Amycolatopsis sp. H20-H5]MEC3975120.1 peroxiredoxin-like family protein [Amycolatopsis sp. H20-H5]
MSELSTGLNAIAAGVRGAVPEGIATVLEAEPGRNVDGADPAGFAAVGDKLNAFTLRDANGGEVSLDELVANGPAVLVFYRGAWCPYCNLTLRTYQQELVPVLDGLGIRLAAISPQLPDGSLSAKEANELTFAVLSDLGNEVARSLGITFMPSERIQSAMATLGADLPRQNGTASWELAYPTVVVVDRDRTVRFIDVHPDYTTRTEPEAIVAAVKAL